MSKLFSRMPEKMKAFLSHEKAMYFNHKFGVETKTFYGNRKKNNFPF